MYIDIHTHPAEKDFPGISRDLPAPERLIKMLDQAGIARAVILGIVSPEAMPTLTPTEEILRIAARRPDRFIPFCNLDPRFVGNSPGSDFRPLLTAYRELGCRGIGEYTPNLLFDDPLNLNLFGQVEETGLPLTFHIAPAQGGYGCIDEPGLPRLEKVLRTFPGLVLFGHSQPFWAEIGRDATGTSRRGYPEGKIVPGRLYELMRRYPNLHGDLSARSGFNAISRDPETGCAFMEEFQDRLCFGTDLCHDPQETPIVGYFEKLRAEKLLSAQALEKIAWRNADRLLKLGLAPSA